MAVNELLVRFSLIMFCYKKLQLKIFEEKSIIQTELKYF